MESNWSNLPNDLLDDVSKHFTIMNDLVRLGAVCVSWQSYFTLNRNHPLPRKVPRQPPVLMVTNEKEQSKSFHNLFSSVPVSVPGGELKTCNFPMHVPHDKFIYGSSHGWLVIGDFDDLSVYLFNPFLTVNNRIDLPKLTSLIAMENSGSAPGDSLERRHIRRFITKAVLSANPTFTSDYTLTIIYSCYNKLAFFKPGNRVWTPVGEKEQRFNDVVYLKDNFYAVCTVGAGFEVFACDISDPGLKLRKFAALPPHENLVRPHFVIDSFGELLLVRKHNSGNRRTTHYKVFKLVVNPSHVKDAAGNGEEKDGKLLIQLSTEVKTKWIEMKTLHGQSIFVGNNSSYSIASSDFHGCKPNRIYFTDDFELAYTRAFHDLGVYNVEEGALEEHPVITAFRGMVTLPFWLEPTVLGASVC